MPAKRGEALQLAALSLMQLRAFASTVTHGSLSQAARHLGLTPSSISKYVSQLERALGARLINRTTRRVTVTELGARFAERCSRMLQELETAQAELEESGRSPQGRLKISAPGVFAVRHVSPCLPAFLKRFPKITVEVSVGLQVIDLLKEEVDVAIRATESVDPGFVAIKLAPNRRAFCASPGYLARFGEPKQPKELAKHQCVLPVGNETVHSWPYVAGKSEARVAVRPAFMANNGELLRDAIVGDVGIGLLPTFLIYEDLRAGRIVEILKPFCVQKAWIYAVLPQRKYVPAKSRALVDFLKERYAPPPYWDL